MLFVPLILKTVVLWNNRREPGGKIVPPVNGNAQKWNKTQIYVLLFIPRESVPDGGP